MKILVVCQYYYPEPFRITDICETLVSEGHELTVLTGLPNYPEGRILDDYRRGRRRKETINGVQVIRSFEIGRGQSKARLFANYFSFSLSASFKALFIKEKYEAIFVNQLSPVMMAIPAIAYKKRHKTKILLYCLDLWPDSLLAGGIKDDSIVYKVFLKLSRWIYSSADTILVTSSMFREYFDEVLDIKADNIKHLPQYAEDLFAESTNSTRKHDIINFIFAGNIGDIQSVETIIRAANELKDHPEIIFHIIGDGSKLEECKQLANDFNLKNVTFYGRRPVSEMPNFYGMADAMLITLKDSKALSYTLPGKVQSYLAAGKPIVGAINGETRQVIEEAACGLCCDAEDYKSLSQLLLDFCKSDKGEEMAANSKKFYLENYSKSKFIEILERELVSLEAKAHV